MPRGPVEVAFTHCGLCPAGCGLKVRSVGGSPVSVHGVPGHPLSAGFVCALGLAGRYLSYHPSRIVEPTVVGTDGQRRGIPFKAAVRQLGKWLDEARSGGGHGSVAILDNRPDRMRSLAYRKWLGALDGVHVKGLREDAPINRLRAMLDGQVPELGLDIARARTVLSFGAPVLEGLGSGEAGSRLRGRSGTEKPYIVQIETRPSRTAHSADLWLRIAPGTETVLALGLANILVSEGLYDKEIIGRTALDLDGPGGYRELVARFSPKQVARITGIDAATIKKVARRFASGPAVVIPGVDPGGGPLSPEAQTAAFSLSLLNGDVGRPGGVVARRVSETIQLPGTAQLANTVELADVPDGSIRLLIADGIAGGCAMPTSLLKRKLNPSEGRVVSLSPFERSAMHEADLVLPSTTPFESIDETGVPIDSPVDSMGLTVPSMRAPDYSVDSLHVLSMVTKSNVPKITELLRSRSDRIHAGGRGSVFDPSKGESAPITEFKTAGHLWRALLDGGLWTDSSATFTCPPFRLMGADAAIRDRLHKVLEQPSTADGWAHELVLMPFGWRDAPGDGPLPPVMAKLFRETRLRLDSRFATICPGTAKDLGFAEGDKASIKTSLGSITVEVVLDPAVANGVVHVAVGPSTGAFGDATREKGDQPLDLPSCKNDDCWRVIPAKMLEVVS